jgi:hypothetical protein
MEAEVMLEGKWANFEELEEHLNLDELNLLVKAIHDREFRRNRFAAALKGHDLPDPNRADPKAKFEEIKARANARLAGVDPEEYAQSKHTTDLAASGWSVQVVEEPKE